MELAAELKALARAFHDARVEYALCGGMAMAVYGVPRATMDIDLLVLAKDMERAIATARNLGFVLPAGVMDFSGGRVRIHRVSKPGNPDEEALPLDFLECTGALLEAWDSRRTVDWEGSPLVVVDKDGLKFLKNIRDSLQDKADIAALEATDHAR